MPTTSAALLRAARRRSHLSQTGRAACREARGRAPGVGLLDLIGLERDLAKLLGVPVDVVPADSLKTRIRDQVEREAIPL